MPIRILPDHVVSRIRAGEVIERPAQIVKELCENAMDAGATAIHVSIANGGRSLVTVEDNGSGMSPSDLVLATERHATSKLPDDSLLSVDTLGFRGEALAAIGAVTAMSIQSRTPDGDCGWVVTVSNGVRGGAAPCAQRPGTRVEVRDLFAAHPARAAFLRGARHEAAAIREIVENLALARPDIAFTLESDTRRVPALPVATFDGRIRAVMGADFHSNSVALSHTAEGIGIAGRIGLPSWRNHAAVGQRILANGRPVRDRTVASALKGAFGDISKEAAPAGVISVSVPPEAIDINAHPSKAEIRWRDPKPVSAAVRAAVDGALLGAGPVTATSVSALAMAAALPVSLADPLTDPESRPLGRAIGLAMGTFIVALRSDCLLLVDAHAAHERLVYARLRRELPENGITARPLASPVLVQVGEAAAALLDGGADSLARMGLSIQAADGGMVIVHSVPDPLRDADAETLVREIASELAEDPCSDPLRQRLDRLCGLLSCHAAIRSGDPMDVDSMNSLLREMEASPDIVSVCIHGRPTVRRLGRDAVESLFERR